MSQRSITSFFSKIPSTKKNSEKDTGAGSINDGKISEDSSPKNGKIDGDTTLKKSKPEKSPLQKKVEKALKSPKLKSAENPKKRESKTSVNKIDKISKPDKEKSEKPTTSDKKESEKVLKSDKENKSSSSEESEDVKPAKKQKRDKETSRTGGKKRRKIIEPSDSSSEEETNEKKIRLSNEADELESDKYSKKSQKSETDGKLEENEKSFTEANGEIKSEESENEPNENKNTSNIEEKENKNLNESAEENETNTEKKGDVKKSCDEEKKPKQTSLVMFGASSKEKCKDSHKNEVEYNPSKDKYDPIEDACWKKSESVPYSALASTWSQIEAVSARLKIADILCNYFRSVIALSPDDLLPSVYLCLNRLAPAHEGLELGIAETHLMKAICQSTGRTVAQLKSELHTLGDLGLVAERSRTNQRTLFSFRPARLTVRAVHAALKEVATMGGHASVQRKVDKIRGMMVACDKTEARFLTRSLAGKLRIGLAEQTVLQALAAACTRTPPGQEYPPKILDTSVGISSETFKKTLDEAVLAIRTACCECPNYGLIIPALLEGGVSELSTRCPMKPGIPLKPMLAHPTKGVSEVLQRFEGMRFTCEWKYDGERAQIHRADDGTVRIYSRNQEDNTSKYPDIINRLDKCIGEGVQSFILDCESVAWNKEGDGHILPFQVLSTRKRKGASEADIQVQVCVFMFDLLYFNGEPLVRKPLKERRDLLKKYFKESPGEWAFASARDTSTVDEIQEFLDESVKGNCEGLMVKTLEVEATYEIARRSRNWLKLKKDYLDGVGDTLDLVVLGGYLGKGKRTGTYGGFLLGCYDKENEEYQSICKIGTGFTDTDLKTLTDALKPHVIETAKPYYRYDGNHEPDHWFDTVHVWEVKCADLSLSPVHRAALGIIDPEKGISLRFPRFVKVREDKTAEEATSARQVADMYSNQDQIKNQAKTGTGTTAEEDFY